MCVCHPHPGLLPGTSPPVIRLRSHVQWADQWCWVGDCLYVCCVCVCVGGEENREEEGRGQKGMQIRVTNVYTSTCHRIHSYMIVNSCERPHSIYDMIVNSCERPHSMTWSSMYVYTTQHIQLYDIQSSKRQDDLCHPQLKFILHTHSAMIIHNVEFN